MFKNVASQKIRVFAFDATTNLPKTGDAANISAYISKDFGAITQLTDTTATEEDSTNAKGYYLFDISQTETNADDIEITGKSSTSNIVVVGAPARIFPYPPNFTLFSIDSNGRIDAIKIAGTTQTARDLGASVLLSSGTGAGQISLSSGAVLLQATQTGVTIPTVTTLTNAPSDSSGVTTLLTRLSATRAGYLDNLSAGAVATAAKLLSYFQSALRKDVTVDADIGGNYDDATDSQEAIRDRGDAAWTTATGFSTLDAAGIRTAVGLASANLDTQLGAIDDFLDTEIAAILAAVDTEVADIKTKTDSLTFTVAGVVDANIQRINDVTVNGDGSGTPWGP